MRRLLLVDLFIGFFLLMTFAIHAKAMSIGKNGMAVSEVKIASQVGTDILRAGGNAIDAAVAMGYALAVVNPCCGNIGGGGFMTIHLADGKNIFLNFREKAPSKATPNMYLDAKGNVIADTTTKGYLAVAVPGTVLGLETALKLYGSMPRETVMAPAIKLAEEGFILPPYSAKQLAEHQKEFRLQPNVAAIFLKKNSEPYQAGERLTQKNLANTLKAISKQGSDAFYKGQIAKTIVRESKLHGGILSLSDFMNYNVEKLNPIYCQYHDYTVISSPPPSSGGITLCEMLNILDYFSLHPSEAYSLENVRIIIEAMRDGFNDRNAKLGDPNFVKNPTEQLLSKKYASELANKIRQHQKITLNKMPQMQRELTDTTHFSVVDKKGNAVALTYTLNGFFGAGVMAGNTGFFLNDEMDDFSTHKGASNKFGLVQSDRNDIQPNKRPLSSMTPTIVMKNGHVVLVLGSPGGPRIITAVLLTFLNTIDYKMSIENAINGPRFHYQSIPDEVYIEPHAFSLSVINKLSDLGYHITPQKTWAAVEAISIDTNNNLMYGANDIRRPDGAAVGY